MTKRELNPCFDGFLWRLQWSMVFRHNKVVNACLLCLMLKFLQNMRTSQHSWSTCPLWMACPILFSLLFDVQWFLTGQNMALICLRVSYFPATYGPLWKKDEYIFKNKTHKKKTKHVCFLQFVLEYLHVALAAYVPCCGRDLRYGHSCNDSVVLSKNVSTWNKPFGYFL